jgi:hypothetical protein
MTQKTEFVVNIVHGRMASGGHGLPEVSLGQSIDMAQSITCHALQGVMKASSLWLSSTPLDTPRRWPLI